MTIQKRYGPAIMSVGMGSPGRRDHQSRYDQTLTAHVSPTSREACRERLERRVARGNDRGDEDVGVEDDPGRPADRADPAIDRLTRVLADAFPPR
jgi:hypothetical protein